MYINRFRHLIIGCVRLTWFRFLSSVLSGVHEMEGSDIYYNRSSADRTLSALASSVIISQDLKMLRPSVVLTLGYIAESLMK